MGASRARTTSGSRIAARATTTARITHRCVVFGSVFCSAASFRPNVTRLASPVVRPFNPRLTCPPVPTFGRFARPFPILAPLASSPLVIPPFRAHVPSASVLTLLLVPPHPDLRRHTPTSLRIARTRTKGHRVRARIRARAALYTRHCVSRSLSHPHPNDPAFR